MEVFRRGSGLAVALVATALLAAACGGSKSSFKQPPPPGPPVGTPLLPDLQPAPPTNVGMSKRDGRWNLVFDSTMVNVGRGAFLLRATRDGDSWSVVEEIPYSKGGAKPVPLVATLVWGGDGHNHWHIARIATTRLVRLDAKGKAAPRGGRLDSKAGFCFFDYAKYRAHARALPVYSRFRCGKHGDKVISMGLSVGWADTYPWVLPGQSIDVTGLHDGLYRLWAIVDERGWFKEANTRNDATWVDIRLTSHGNLRFARVLATGPKPR